MSNCSYSLHSERSIQLGPTYRSLCHTSFQSLPARKWFAEDQFLTFHAIKIPPWDFFQAFVLAVQIQLRTFSRGWCSKWFKCLGFLLGAESALIFTHTFAKLAHCFAFAQFKTIFLSWSLLQLSSSRLESSTFQVQEVFRWAKLSLPDVSCLWLWSHSRCSFKSS